MCGYALHDDHPLTLNSAESEQMELQEINPNILQHSRWDLSALSSGTHKNTFAFL